MDYFRKLFTLFAYFSPNFFSYIHQIKWGGRYQEGAGLGTGEEMEQLFSYLSRLNSTTKNMSAAGINYVPISSYFMIHLRYPVLMLAFSRNKEEQFSFSGSEVY